jgi:hypothetical protein
MVLAQRWMNRYPRSSILLSAAVLPPRNPHWLNHIESHSQKISLHPTTIHHSLCHLWVMRALNQKQSMPRAQATIRRPEHWNHPIREHPNRLYVATLGQWKQVSTVCVCTFLKLGESIPDLNKKSPRSGPVLHKCNHSPLQHPTHYRIWKWACLFGRGCASPITGSKNSLEVAHCLPPLSSGKIKHIKLDFKATTK